MNRYSVVVILIGMLLGGCSAQHATIKVTDSQVYNKEKTQGVERLYAQLQEWQGVHYQMGGLSKRGIDCSGFVHRTYKDRFGIKLPRTTGQQAKSGQPVSLNAIQTGDLVFFNTGFRVKHVGVYVENGRFLHASTSKGVMLSKLSNPYWSSHYWKTIRIPQFSQVMN